MASSGSDETGWAEGYSTRAVTASLVGIVAMGALGLFVGLLGQPRGTGGRTPSKFLGDLFGQLAMWVSIGTIFFGWAWVGHRLTAPIQWLQDHRLDVHIWASVAATGFAVFHTAEMLAYPLTVGWISGTLATVYLLGLFVTGWYYPRLREAWGKIQWRTVHWVLAVGTAVLAVLHFLITDGHF
jgi:hypothetical protein